MACTYCATSLAIPEHLRTKTAPRVEKSSTQAGPAQRPEDVAPDLLRKAQPIALGAWNLYAAWTWLRWLIPTCLVIAFLMFTLCAVLGVLPIVFRLFR
jgi:hypothetical protein